MKKLFAVTLGILSAIGGFVDIGDIVANAATGARFGLKLAWVVVVGVFGIVLFAEMSGRIAAVSGRPVFDLVRERLGPRIALANLLGSLGVNFLTMTAEIAGIALAVELITSVDYLVWIPACALVVWVIIWRVGFESIERTFGLAGLALVAFAIAVWRFGPDWSALLHDATHPSVPKGEGHPTYWFWVIALFGAAMTPYEVFFFSSGAVEERWTRKDLMLNRANVYVGIPLGGLLSLTIMAIASLVLQPASIDVGSLSQVGAPVALELGKVGLGIVLVVFLAAMGGAAIETAMSTGYTIAQFFGWSWGKLVRSRLRRRQVELRHRQLLRVGVPRADARRRPRRDPVDARDQGGRMNDDTDRLDAGLHLLDRQIVDSNGRPVAKVDDLELSDDDVPVVSAILCGPAAWGPRLGGRLGRWIVNAHWRLTRRGPVRIPWAMVARVHNAVDLRIPRDRSGAMELDVWVREHFVGRIPGAGHATD